MLLPTLRAAFTASVRGRRSPPGQYCRSLCLLELYVLLLFFFNLFDPAKGAFGFVSHVPWPTKFAVRFRAQLAAPGAPL